MLRPILQGGLEMESFDVRLDLDGARGMVVRYGSRSLMEWWCRKGRVDR